MSARGRGRKRKTRSEAESVGDGSRLLQPEPGNPVCIDFEEILRASDVFPNRSRNRVNEGCGSAESTVSSNNLGVSTTRQQTGVEPVRMNTEWQSESDQATMQPPSLGQPSPTPPALSNLLNDSMSANRASPELTRLSCDDIAAHVPSSLKLQIAKGEYVNLALLLKGAIELTDFYAGCELKLSTNGTLVSSPRECKDKINSIEKWTDAFIIYASIYLNTRVDKVYELLQIGRAHV